MELNFQINWVGHCNFHAGFLCDITPNDLGKKNKKRLNLEMSVLSYSLKSKKNFKNCKKIWGKINDRKQCNNKKSTSVSR